MGRSFVTSILRELHLAISDRVTQLTLVVIGGLTLLALLAGWLRTAQRDDFQEILTHQNLLQRSFLESSFDDSEASDHSFTSLTQIQSERQFELQMSAKSPDLMRYIGGIWWTIYPVAPTSSLSMGASEKWPDHYHHAGSSITKTLTASIRSNPLLAIFGAFDLTLLVAAILPLAVIVLNYNVVAADREQGRWPLVELHANSLPRLIALRCVVRTGALMFIVVSMTFGCVLMAAAGEGGLPAVLNIWIWTTWIIAYLAFWTALSIFVNSFSLSSSGTGLLLLLCWTILVIAVPSVVKNEVNRKYQIPPWEQLVSMEDQVQRTAEQDNEAIWAEFLSRHSEIALDSENPQQEYLLRDIALNRFVRSRVREQIKAHHQLLLDRESFLDLSQFFSPLIAWRTAADQSAGTSLRHFLDFADQSVMFHEEYIHYFELFSIAGQELSSSDIQSIPRFDAERLHLKLHWPSLLMSAGSLVLWTFVVGFFSWWNLRRCAIS